jgi:hypothetical protein
LLDSFVSVRRLESDLTSSLSVVLELEPCIDSSVDSQGGKLDNRGADHIVFSGIIIINGELEIIVQVVDLKGHLLVPNWFLPSLLASSSLSGKSTKLHLYVRVHL